jgi:hypothetical protein
VRPIYMQSFAQNEDQGYKALTFADGAVRKRIAGIRPVRDNSFEVFQKKFREGFRPVSDPSKLGQEPNRGAGGAFETSLLLLFSTFAALTEKPEVSPDDVVAALTKVTDPNAPTKVTLNDIPLGIQQLNAKQPIKLNGLFTFFDFDFARSTAKPKWTTWCLDNTGSYRSADRAFENGVFTPGPACE